MWHCLRLHCGDCLLICSPPSLSLRADGWRFKKHKASLRSCHGPVRFPPVASQSKPPVQVCQVPRGLALYHAALARWVSPTVLTTPGPLHMLFLLFRIAPLYSSLSWSFWSPGLSLNVTPQSRHPLYLFLDTFPNLTWGLWLYSLLFFFILKNCAKRYIT